MNNIEYYKSLISDEEVIKALVKESKAREGDLLREKTRLRPNLNFFQRTVTNLVTSNKRVSTTKELVQKKTERALYKVRGRIKSHRTLIKEIVTSNKIDKVEPRNESNKHDDSTKVSESGRSTQSCKSTDTPSDTEKSYREDLSKYFVQTSETKTNNRRLTQNLKPALRNTAKSKSIVFNINIRKDSLTKPANVSKQVSKSEKRGSSVRKTSQDDVISISSSPSTSSDCEVIPISESESD